MSYELFCASVIGASHIRKNIPCEDFGIKYQEKGLSVFAIGDGHGDPNCFRSNIGSELACKTAIIELIDFAKEHNNPSNTAFDSDIHSLLSDIVRKWKSSVLVEAQNNPFTEDELSKASTLAEAFRNNRHIESAYGTTLIACLATKEYMLLIQQGDGHCIAFAADGTVLQPIPWDERCIGNATTSLCDNDATESFRYAVINLEETPIVACIAGSDGVEDSFPTSIEKTFAYYRDIISDICSNGTLQTEYALPEKMSILSQNGSADDITICGIVDVESASPLLEKFEKQNKIIELETTISILSGKITSIEEGGKFNHLKQVYEKTVSEYELIIGNENSSEDEKAEISQKKERAELEYFQYRDKYESFKEQRNSIVNQLEEIQNSLL